MIDVNGVVLSVDGPVEDTLGYRANELIGRAGLELIHPDELLTAMTNWLALEPGVTRTSENRYVRADGTSVWMLGSYLRAGADSDPHVLVVAQDITDRIRRQEELVAQRDSLRDMTEQRRDLVESVRGLANQVPTPVFLCDEAARVTLHNDRWTLVAGDAARLHDLVSPGDHAALDAALATDDGDEHALEVDGADGETVWLARLRRTRAGSDHIVGSITDVTEAARIRRRARRDHLTGALNRVTLEDVFRDRLAGGDASLMLVFVDLDGFKAVNDTFGHDAGDAVLSEIARRLAAGVRSGDLVSRYGGDEFVVVLQDAAGVDEAGAARRIEQMLGGPIKLPVERSGPPPTWQPRASVGAARIHPGDDLAAVVGRADLAMLAVKRDRRRTPSGPDR